LLKLRSSYRTLQVISPDSSKKATIVSPAPQRSDLDERAREHRVAACMLAPNSSSLLANQAIELTEFPSVAASRSDVGIFRTFWTDWDEANAGKLMRKVTSTAAAGRISLSRGALIEP
jgi:hypothetical protein